MTTLNKHHAGAPVVEDMGAAIDDATGDATDATKRADGVAQLGNLRGQAGFTLVELLVVMVILGMLASLVLPNFFSQAGKARVKTARVQMTSLSTALDAYALDTGRYPSSSEGLEALISQPSGAKMWDGPYLKKLPKDPWGNDYEYKGPERSSDYDIISYGADGRAGGSDDGADIALSDN